MKVLLVNPAWPTGRAGQKRYGRAWPPLDLLNAAALLLRGGHRVMVVDLRANPHSARRSAGTVRSAAHEADLIILQTTPLDRWQCPNLEWEALSGLAEPFPKHKLFLAGAHGLMRPAMVLEMTGAKALITGEPEWTIADLADRGGHEATPGLCFPGGGQDLIRTADRPLGDLDDLPPPAYGLIGPESYGYPLLGGSLGLLETSRGCGYRCHFCFQGMYGRGRRLRSLDLVMSDLARLIAWGAKSIYFMDLEFTLDRDRTMELCERMAGRKMLRPWCCQTRADHVDPELLSKMRAAGCRLIHFGLETASQRLLERIGKGMSPDRADEAVRLCREAGIETAGFFLFGLPGETERDRRSTVNLALGLGLNYASFHVGRPPCPEPAWPGPVPGWTGPVWKSTISAFWPGTCAGP